jgi:hypothetical protein
LERRGLVFGAAAGGAEHVSGLNYTLLPEPRPGNLGMICVSPP